jgi:hypothetical protein
MVVGLVEGKTSTPIFGKSTKDRIKPEPDLFLDSYIDMYEPLFEGKKIPVLVDWGNLYHILYTLQKRGRVEGDELKVFVTPHDPGTDHGKDNPHQRIMMINQSG